MNGFNGIVKTTERWSDTLIKSSEISSEYGGLLTDKEMKSFDPMFFGISPSEADSIDPQQRTLLKCTWEALENAQIDPLKIRGTNTPVFIGCSTNDFLEINKSSNYSASTNIFGGISCSIANRVSYCFDLRGESMTIDSACSSSLNSIRLGYNSIKSGNSILSITGGTNFILDPFISKSFGYQNMTSKSGKSMSFDADADGMVRAEGTGIIVMKRLKDAIADGNNIYCVIDGASSNIDSSGLSDKPNFYCPSKTAQSINIKQALLSTNGLIKANDIDYIEAHGTSTPTGDPIECEGISMALTSGNGDDNSNRSNPLLIGSIKSNIGHCEAASGAIGLIKCCLMFKYQCFAPNINFKTPNPAIKFDEWNLKVVTQPTSFPSNKKVSMAINNFGITGSNCCLILSQHIDVVGLPLKQQSQQNYIIPFSANSIKSLKQYQSKINQNNNIDFNQFVQQQIRSKSIGLIQRSVIIASNWNEFNNQQSNFINTENDKLTSNMSLSSIKKNVNMVFIFCGQSSQYQTMGKQLYDTEPIFKQSMDKIDCILSKYYGFSPLDKFRSIPVDDTYTTHDPFLAQPSILMIQISLFELYKHWGIKPSFIIGHSLGEITAAYCSGMLDLESVCHLIYHRSITQSKTNGVGKMLSINIGADEFLSKYSTRYPLIEISCYNSPTSTVIGGNEIQLNEISLELKDQGIFSVMLGSLASYHTSSQLVIKDDIVNIQFNSVPPTTPTFSTVTCSLFSEGESPLKFNSEYVFESILKPVRFSKTISNLYHHIESNEHLGNQVIFIEIAPHPTLSFHLNQMIPKQSKYFKNGSTISIYSPLSKKKSNDQKEIQIMISKLYCQGYSEIDFKCQLSNQKLVLNDHACIDLPLYQWDEQEYWAISSNFKDYLKNGSPINHLGVTNSINSPLFKSYQTFIDIGKPHFQWLKGHKLNRGKCYFPGVGYIDNILNLFGQPSATTTTSTSTTVNQTQQKLPDILISFMEFKVPLVLIEGVSSCLQTNIYQTGKKEYKSIFHYRDVKNEQWIQTCGGNFQLFNSSDNKIVKYDIEELISNVYNLTRISKQELYNKCKNDASLEYGGVFRSLEECFVGNDCILSKISLELPLVNQSSSFLFPSIIDCCFHGAFALLEKQGQYVFSRLERLTYYPSRVPFGNEQQSKHTHIYSLTHLIGKHDNSYFAKVVVCLEDGTVIFEIENVVLTSTVPIKDSLSIEYPTNELFSIYLQSKNSPIPTPSYFNNIYHDDKFKSETTELVSNYSKYKSFLIKSFYKNIISRCPEITIDKIKSMDIQQLKSLYCNNNHHKRLFTFVFESLKENIGCLEFNEMIASDQNQHDKLFSKSTKVISKLLFPLVDEDLSIDNPQSLFDNGLLDSTYTSKDFVLSENQMVSEIIQQSIEPILNEKMVFRILEFGGGVCSLSELVLDKINSLLNEYPNYQIDIEYTWSDISPSFIPDAKVKLSKFNENINIIYKPLNLEQPLIGNDNQGLLPSYYDFVIMSNVLHVIKNVKYGVDKIYKLLAPCGQLLFVEPNYKSIFADSIFGAFDQWWAFEDTDIRVDRCCMKQETWLSLLKCCNFNPDIKMSKESVCFVIQAQKPSLLSQSSASSNENIIIYGNNESFIKSINQHGNKKNVQIISTVESLNEIMANGDQIKPTIIYFIKTIDQLTVDNFKEITLEYIQINQMILNLNLTNCIKHVLITCESESTNYLTSSLIGSARYFDEFNQLKLFTLSFDSISMDSCITCGLPNLIDILTDSTMHIQREFIIKNNQVYFERYKNETKLSDNFKSNSFVDVDQLMSKLNSSYGHELVSKQSELETNQIEVKVLARGINYKDYLVYSGLVDVNLAGANINDGDMSGIVTRVGSNASSEFKVGDEVYGYLHGNKDHTIVVVEEIDHKPWNITHLEAASIKTIYMTSYHSLYKVGALQSDESILIHSATGGIGLSTLEILKWKKHTGLIFCTVGSLKKKQYLIDNYGDMITGIYSSRNKEYVNEIKSSVKQLNGKTMTGDGGIDLVLNTLSSSDYMESNFNCLNVCGKIVDLSITHLNANEYFDNKKFKFNFGYHNVEIVLIPNSLAKKYLKLLSTAIENGELKTIPIIEYSSEHIKQAIEYINERVHIGKIVLNYENHYSNVVNKLKQELRNKTSILQSNYQIQQSILGKNIIITGQSGIVFEVLKWMVKYSNNTIENIIILSKSSIKWQLELLINKTKLYGNDNIKFHFKSIDVSNSKLVDQSISEILADNPTITNIDSIFHYAFTQIDCGVNEISMNEINVSHGAKTMGAINLHEQSIARGWKLLNFVVASSVASLLGSFRQCSYVSSCCVLDSLSRYRVSIGLPCISINYGYIKSTGFVSRNESVAKMLDGEGLAPISTNTILGSLDLQLQNQLQCINSIVCSFTNDFTSFKNESMLAKFDYQTNKSKQNAKQLNISTLLDNKDGGITESIINKISELLSIEQSKINHEIRLIDYGADSLVIVSIKNHIEKELSIPNIITIQQLQNKTIQDSISIVKSEFDKKVSTEIVKNSKNNNNNFGSFERKLKINTKLSNKEFWDNQLNIDDLNNVKSSAKHGINGKGGDDIKAFITGTTGLLGVYLLSHLLQLSKCSIVYCLIRNKSKSVNAIDEIISNLKHHQLYDKLTNDQLLKIVVVVGDLSLKEFGIPQKEYSTLVENVNLIINSGADINLESNYQSNKPVNVDGVKECIKLSISCSPPIKIVNFSSFSVFYNQEFKNDQQEFNESILPSLDNIENLPAGYMQSKVIAEYILLKSSEQFGIPSMIIRPPGIFANHLTGIGHESDFTHLLLQSCYALKSYPLMNMPILVNPVTWLSNNIINIILNENCWNNNNHTSIYNVHGDTIKSSLLLNVFNSNYGFKEIDFGEWKELLFKSNHKSCIKLRTFHSLDISRYNFNNDLKISKSTKSLLKSMGSFGDEDCDGFKLTHKMIINHINYKFR